jgi:translocation and assembly module TamB
MARMEKIAQSRPLRSFRAMPRWLRVLLALVLIFTLGLYLAGREASLQWALQRVAAASGGQLRIDGVHGSVYGPLHVTQITYKTAGSTLSANNIDIDWRPWRLLGRHLAVSHLRADTLRIESSAASGPPPTLPASLALPLRLTIDETKLQHLIIDSAGQRTTLDALALRASADAGAWRVQDARMKTPWGNLAANLSLGSERPFALDGKFDLNAAPFETTLQGRLGGDLSALALNLNAQRFAAAASAQLSLRPFDAFPLGAVTLTIQHIDPATLRTGLPHADLSVDLAATWGEAAPHRLQGHFLLDNHATTGSLDMQRLPLRGISTRLDGDLAAMRFDDLLLDLAAAGKFTGSGNLGNPGNPGKKSDGAQAAFTLHTDRIDLHAIDTRLNQTAIAGDIVLGGTDGAQTLTAALAQGEGGAGLLPSMRLDLDARLADGLLQLRQAHLRAGASDAKLSAEMRLDKDQPFMAEVQISHFNPAQFGQYPKADLNTQLHIVGQLASAPHATLKFSLGASRLFDQALSGQGALKVDARHVHDVDLALKLGGNAMAAQGGFGAGDDRLQWRIDARQLESLHAGLGGALAAKGDVTGSFQEPMAHFNLDGKRLRWRADPGQKQARGATDSRVQAHGQVALRGGAADLTLNAVLQGINPAAFGASLEADLNGEIAASGRLGDDWHGKFDGKLGNSTLLGAPFSGHARFAIDRRQLADADIDLHLADNHILAHGNFGRDDGKVRDRFDWRIDAPHLAALGPQFGGRLNGNGSVQGTLQAPQLALALEGRDIQLFGQIGLKTLRASAHGQAGQDSPFQADIDAGGAQLFGLDFDALQLRASGTPRAHTLRASARGTGFDAQTELAGGWSAQRGWDGMLRTLKNSGNVPVQLQAPAPLRISSLQNFEQLSLRDAVLTLASGRLMLDKLEKNGAQLHTSGRAAAVPFNLIGQLLPSLRETISGDLSLGAEWSLNVGQNIDGSLHVFRDGGDLVAGAELPLALGLTRLDARADIVANALRLTLDMGGARVGQAQITLATQLAMRDGRWGVPGSSSLRVNGSADMPSLAWLAPLSGQPGLELGGKLDLVFKADGSVAAPQLSGTLTGDDLALRWTSQGLKMRNGVLRAQWVGDKLLLQRLRFEGEQGSAQADGWLRFADAAMTLHIKWLADHLEVLSRPDRFLVVSGQGNLRLDQKQWQLNGKLKAERAQIELAAQDAPVMSDDVVLHGKHAPAAKPGMALPFNLVLEADLGDQFMLKGQGLDAQIGGTIQINATSRRPPRAVGSVRVVKGVYAAYGQKLQIERGLIAFSGALDNPGLNILAVRKVKDKDAEGAVEAGIEIRGSALAPQARLVSTPSVADSEKLSWLVLGHGSAGVAGQELDLLGAAAGALFGGSGPGLQSRVANTLGVDEIGVARAKGLESTVVTVGKRISSRAYLSFEQGTGGTAGLAKLRYTLNPRVSLQVQTGANNAVDVFYTWKFD